MNDIAEFNPDCINDREGFCYVIIYSNGTVKAGRTRDILVRYRQHKIAAIKHGLSISMVLFTAQHELYEETERQLLSALRLVSAGGIGEYFQGVTKDAAVDAIESLGLEVIQATHIVRWKDRNIIQIDAPVVGDENKTDRLYIRLKPSLKKEVIDAAQRHDLTLSEWVEQAIKKALKNEST